MIDYNRHIKAYRMILSEKFWSDRKISEAFLMGLEISFSGEFCDSESRIFFHGSRSLGFVFLS